MKLIEKWWEKGFFCEDCKTNKSVKYVQNRKILCGSCVLKPENITEQEFREDDGTD